MSSSGNQDRLLRSSAIAAVTSLGCILALAVYLAVDGGSFTDLLLIVAAPLALHALALFLLLKRPGATAITTSIYIGVFAFIASLLSAPITMLVWAVHNFP
jgi:hypothetical protein